jgi:hypothetical protein
VELVGFVGPRSELAFAWLTAQTSKGTARDNWNMNSFINMSTAAVSDIAIAAAAIMVNHKYMALPMEYQRVTASRKWNNIPISITVTVTATGTATATVIVTITVTAAKTST